VIDFFLPYTSLILVVNSDSTGAFNAFPVTKENDKLRLDPTLKVAFINTGKDYILVKYIQLFVPMTPNKNTSDRCNLEKTFDLQMISFKASDGTERTAEPFTITPREIIPTTINFAGIPDINGSGVKINNHIPICLHIEVLDIKGRHHDFYLYAFDITESSENRTTYVTTIEDNGVSVLRFSQFWNIIH